MKKFLETIKGLDSKFVYILLAGAILALAVADYFLIAGPQISGIVAIDKKITQLRKDAEMLTTNKQRLALFQIQLEAARRDVKKLNAMVYKSDEISSALNKISSLASEYGVKIKQLVPQAMDVKPLVTNEEGKFYGMGIFVRTSAGYHQFGRFINRLEREGMFWRVEDFVMSADDKDTQRHLINLTLKVLILEK
jgi:Tfp pilus assembly protein PilO